MNQFFFLHFFIFFGYKIPPILVSKVLISTLKVYRNPCMRAELSEIFKIDVVLHDLKMEEGPPPQFLWGREIGVFQK